MSEELTAQQLHNLDLIQHLRERRQSLRGQLETLHTLEAQKTRLQDKLGAIEAHLTQLGWVDVPPAQVEES